MKKHFASEDSIITESKMLTDLVTGTEREVDVCIETNVEGHDVVLSIECRDHSRPADVKWIEEMKAKHDRLPTNVLILISRNGFTGEALRVARSYSIQTLALEDVSEEKINLIFGDIGSLWGKTMTLNTTKVVCRVPEDKDLPFEDVSLLPDHLVYSSNGDEIGTVKELVETILGSQCAMQKLGRDAEEKHRGFFIEWEKPVDIEGKPLYFLKKQQPERLRPIDNIQITGACQFKISEFPLERGKLGIIQIAWGKGELLNHPALLFASQDMSGEKKISVTVV